MNTNTETSTVASDEPGDQPPKNNQSTECLLTIEEFTRQYLDAKSRDDVVQIAFRERDLKSEHLNVVANTPEASVSKPAVITDNDTVTIAGREYRFSLRQEPNGPWSANRIVLYAADWKGSDEVSVTDGTQEARDRVTTAQETAASTAFDANSDEIIYHLDLPPETEEAIKDLDGEEVSDQCTMCGSPAVWFTSEQQKDSAFALGNGRLSRYWCDECIPEAFVECWKARPWTSAEQLEEYTPPTASDDETGVSGLRSQQDTMTLVCHLDLQRDSSDVTEVLNHFEISREAARCNDCEAQADWYYADIFDIFRVHDFDAARANSLLCNDCIDPAVVKMWCRWPWTPSEDLEHRDEIGLSDAE